MMSFEKYINIPFETRQYCVICEREITEPTIDLPSFPMTEIFTEMKVEERHGFVDQGFYFCPHCGHGQLLNVIDVNLQYGDSSTYFNRTSQSLSGRVTANLFVDFFNRVVNGREFGTIVELGCNDLYLLQLVKTRAERLIGIDPILSGKEEEFSTDNIIAIGDFFENVDLGRDIDVVICKDTLEHVSCPKQFVEKIVDKASDDTLFFFGFPILEALLSDCRFDQVFHQHLNYFSLQSIVYMLSKLGCSLLDYAINYDHWGCIFIVFKKGSSLCDLSQKVWHIRTEVVLERYESFKVDMEQTQKRLEYFCSEKIYGYGAALMLPVLSYYLGNDLTGLDCIIDDNKNKHGLYYLNLPVPIVHVSNINDLAESVVLLTAIFSKIATKEILTNLFKLNPKYIIYPLRTI